MAQPSSKRELRRLAFATLCGCALASPVGCGNPGEGTVTVSPEARARLRGGPAPANATAATPTKGKPAAKKQVNVKELMRRNPAG